MEHVIYGLCEPGTKFVRYIGYTKYEVEKRLDGHLGEAMKNNTCHRHRWLRSLLRQGLRPATLVLERVTLKNWEARECHWIAKLRKSNRLVNSTEGGEGLINPSRYLRRRIAAKVSVIMKGNQYLLGHVHTAESRQRISAGLQASEKFRRGIRNRKPAKISRKGREGLRVAGGTVWINKDGLNKRISSTSVIPCGWTKGRTPYTEEHRARLSAAGKGQRWIHRGSRSTKISAVAAVPKGWTLGYGFSVPINKLGQFTSKAS